MFVDASALVAVIAREPEATELSSRLDRAGARYTSPVAIFEATLAIARIRRAPPSQVRPLLDQLVLDARIEIIAISPEIGRMAVDAFARYGRGNHPARLNMGDCFAYACARNLGVPLLFKGNDFSQTDIGDIGPRQGSSS